ncbi:MAG: EamA family transporter, partial [Albidovulum sp.]
MIAARTGRAHLAMLTFSALVAGSYSLGGMMANLVAPTAFTAARFLLASVIIGAAVVATGAGKRAALVAPWRYLLLGGL